MPSLPALLLVLAAAPTLDAAAPAVAPLPAPEVTATLSPSTGVLVTGYRFQGGAVANAWSATGVDGRLLVRPWGSDALGLRLDVGAFGFLPLAQGGPSSGVAGVARVGLESGPFAASAGVYVDAFPGPAQVLPSLQASWRMGEWAVALGLLDRALGPVARVSLEHRYFGIGYAGLAGLEGWLRLPVGDALAVEVRGFGSRILPALHAGASVGVVWQLPGGEK